MSKGIDTGKERKLKREEMIYDLIESRFQNAIHLIARIKRDVAQDQFNSVSIPFKLVFHWAENVARKAEKTLSPYIVALIPLHFYIKMLARQKTVSTHGDILRICRVASHRASPPHLHLHSYYLV